MVKQDSLAPPDLNNPAVVNMYNKLYGIDLNALQDVDNFNL